LTVEWTPDIEIQMIVIKECIINWTQHVQNVLANVTNEVDGVSNHNKREIKNLLQAEVGNSILMMQGRFTEADGCVIENWINVTLLV